MNSNQMFSEQINSVSFEDAVVLYTANVSIFIAVHIKSFNVSLLGKHRFVVFLWNNLFCVYVIPADETNLIIIVYLRSLIEDIIKNLKLFKFN